MLQFIELQQAPKQSVVIFLLLCAIHHSPVHDYYIMSNAMGDLFRKHPYNDDLCNQGMNTSMLSGVYRSPWHAVSQYIG